MEGVLLHSSITASLFASVLWNLTAASIDYQNQAIQGLITCMMLQKLGCRCVYRLLPERYCQLRTGRMEKAEEVSTDFTALWGGLQSVPRCVLN